mgnify:CR=1 FL=1
MINFNKDLKRGQIGESIFENLFSNFVAKSKVYAHDFVFTESAKELCGKTIEIKTDSYDPNKTGNFFMERFSDSEKETDGGPWRAKGDRVFWYVYVFLANKTMYVFEIDRLIARLDELCKWLRLSTVKGEGYNPFLTKGYKIPIKDIEDLAAKVSF